MRNFGRKIVFSTYRKIFKEEITDNVELFLKNLGYIALGFGIAKVFTGIFNILAGRILGPGEYGKFALVNSITMFLSLPMLLGITSAMVKYNVEKDDFKRQSTIISTSSILILTFSLFSTLIYFLLKTYFLKLFSTSLSILYLSFFFALVYVFYILATSVLQSLYQMKKRAIVEGIFALILLGTLFFFIYYEEIRSFKAIVFSFYFAYGLSMLFIFSWIYKYFSLRFDKTWAKRLLKYGSYGTLAGVAAIFLTNIDKVMINKYMTSIDLGIYRAYSVPSLGLAFSFTVMFNTVFFPSASRSKNKMVIWRKINKFSPWLFLIGIPVTASFTFLILKLYGSQYPIDFALLVLFAIVAVILCLESFYSWLIAAVGRHGMKICALAATFSALLNIILNFLLIPLMGLKGAILATLIAYLILTLIFFSRKRILYSFPEPRSK